VSTSSPPNAALEAQLASKSATIESMELELSRLRAQAERAASGDPAAEQIAALEAKLSRAEGAAGAAQRELADLKRNLERAAEKAVREGSSLASAEAKARSLEADAASARAERDEAARRADALDKKVTALTTLHKEQDGRTQALRRDKERAEKDLADARGKLGKVEEEAARLRKRDAHDGGGTDGEHLDELEDEERARLATRLRELEAENADLRRGIWHEKRKEMQVEPDFSDVDLGATPVGKKAGAGGFGDFFSALTGGAGTATAEDEGFLDDDDDDGEFDEEAFRRAKAEDAAARIERVREVKRALKNWEGWRLDLVESRRGGGEGAGEIFEV
jgi:chromosome segregation ATPase